MHYSLPDVWSLSFWERSRDLTGRLNGAQPKGSSEMDITKLSRDLTP